MQEARDEGFLVEDELSAEEDPALVFFRHFAGDGENLARGIVGDSGEGFRSEAMRAGVPHVIGVCGSMLTFFFSSDDILDWPTASRCDTAAYAKYFWRLIDRNIYMPCSQFEALFLSTAHTERDIDATIAAAREALV